MRKAFKDILLLVIFTSIFTLIFFVVQFFFFEKDSLDTTIIEEKYIDTTSGNFDLNASEEEKKTSNKILAEELKRQIAYKEKVKNFILTHQNDIQTLPEKPKKYQFTYTPQDINGSLGEKIDGIRLLLETSFVGNFLDYLSVDYFQETNEVRGKMKNGHIYLFNTLITPKEELLAVFTHEFGHYIDIYFLNDLSPQGDVSQSFYDISWKSTKVVLSGQTQLDFVSGYALTNKYEDFAESFVYYVLHNGDFLTKAKKSTFLQAKYDFFQRYLFLNGEFESTNFSSEGKVLDYYRDITKIPFDEVKFLQYLENYI